MHTHICRYTLDGNITPSGEEFISANQEKFTSLANARKSLDVAKFQIYLLKHRGESQLEHSDQNGKYLDILDSKTKWYFIEVEDFYYFYEIIKY